MSDRFDINHVYNILGLKPGASVDEIKQAYRQMAKTWHPDSFLEPQQKLEAEEKIKEINQAYARLKFYQPDETNQSASTSTKIDLTPSNAESFYKLAMEKAQKGKYTEAIEDFSKAIRLNPKYFEAYKYRGLACSKHSSPTPSASPQTKTTIIERTREVPVPVAVPVPQQQVTPPSAPRQPDINITIPPQQPAAEKAPSAIQPTPKATQSPTTSPTSNTPSSQNGTSNTVAPGTKSDTSKTTPPQGVDQSNSTSNSDSSTADDTTTGGSAQ
ncbi:J domain-containing protein [Nostoc favosum]|uniref:DnaJ domain-containing protein n=1 Tax=Nostoc favosum CHAB5714 TaxID=2780399 RepID=A0ABS8IJV4_9NOSO|nr:DnaJ domain-containing protein [Nostoc favosum]MCC5604482.1 DnaJ domain-containing protein [Nostoc favosum CHAB5714]